MSGRGIGDFHRTALVAAWLTLISGAAVLILVVVFATADQGGSSAGQGIDTELTRLAEVAAPISVGTFFLSATVTALTVVRGWRGQRRKALDAAFKIDRLELELEEARRAPPRQTSHGVTVRG